MIPFRSEVGMDLVSLDRFRKTWERSGERLLTKIFTDRESRYCLSRPNPIPHLAARFAAKEAFAKALGHGIGSLCGWKDVSVERADNGRPNLIFSPRLYDYLEKEGLVHHSISLSHCEISAGATVILQWKDSHP